MPTFSALLQEMVPLMPLSLTNDVPVSLHGMFTASTAAGSKDLSGPGVLVNKPGHRRGRRDWPVHSKFHCHKATQFIEWRPDHPACPPTARAVGPLSEDAERLDT